MIILASASPRRKELLARLGRPFAVHPSGVPEDDVVGSPLQVARTLAQRKAISTPADAGDLVLGADTVLDVDGEIVGKPADLLHAREMLAALAGRRHSVITGLALCRKGECTVTAVETRVSMKAYSEREIRAYVASGEPLDKAGAYAIQGLGGALVDTISGCYLNVVGLPLCELGRLLREQGVSVISPICRDLANRPCPREHLLD